LDRRFAACNLQIDVLDRLHVTGRMDGTLTEWEVRKNKVMVFLRCHLVDVLLRAFLSDQSFLRGLSSGQVGCHEAVILVEQP
jgi:hypothetical protein